MKCYLCFIVYIYICHISVNGARPVAPKQKEILTLEADTVIYGTNRSFLVVGGHMKISCKGSHKFQKIEWYDPSGELVKHEPANRVFVQEHFIPSAKSRPQAILVITHALVKDSGAWECHSGDLTERVPLCILDAAEFVETPDEMTVDEGRSITLSCQSRGDPEPEIQWFRNGELLSDVDNKLYTSKKYNRHGFEGLLTIKSITPEDSGAYACEAVQKVPNVDCGYSTSVNITLNVNHSPKFAIPENQTVYIFATNNENVELVCAPSAYPEPTFRWFREIGEMLTEYSDKQFKISDDGSQSVLLLIANETTFGKKFRCQADNEYGHEIQHFQILEMLKPVKISELTITNATDRLIEFNVTWYEEIDFFPVDGFDIQYFEKVSAGTPKEYQWKKAKADHYMLPASLMEMEDCIVQLPSLEPETEYWVRMRAVNELGYAPWSSPILAGTEAESYSDLMADIEGELEDADYGIFYGLFFAGAIVVFAAICMFFVKRL